MNPPFTRNVTREGATADAVAAAFAAFEASDLDQKSMANRMGDIKTGPCYHGNAGISSAFVDLAHTKLKPGGVLALVLPLSAASGLSWQGFRQTLALKYTNLTVFSIAANGQDMAFSSDTGMAECLVIARKLNTDEKSDERTQLVSLTSRPQGFDNADAISKKTLGAINIRKIEDGPYGGTHLLVGDIVSGAMLEAPNLPDEGAWGGLRLIDYSLAQTSWALAHGKLWLPGSPKSLELPLDRLDSIGTLGAYHLDIIGRPPRGPFDKTAASPTSTYPALWNHDATRETHLLCIPDSQLNVRTGMEAKAATVWTTASRAHFNLDFRFNSQPLTAAITDQRSIGGRAWPNVRFEDDRFDFAFSIWFNSTLGLVSFWWHANRQQSGRGITTITAVPSLTVLDFRVLTDAQLATAQAIFDEFREKDLQPAYLADADPNRALLDRRVICGLLGFDESVYQGVRRLAAKWCAEPSAHGGKPRPPGSTLVV